MERAQNTATAPTDANVTSPDTDASMDHSQQLPLATHTTVEESKNPPEVSPYEEVILKMDREL